MERNESDEARLARQEERLTSFVSRSEDDRQETREAFKAIQGRLDALTASVNSTSSGVARLLDADLSARVMKLEQNLNLWKTIAGGGWRVFSLMLGSGVLGALITHFWHVGP